jgi:hypothetical protein
MGAQVENVLAYNKQNPLLAKQNIENFKIALNPTTIAKMQLRFPEDFRDIKPDSLEMLEAAVEVFELFQRTEWESGRYSKSRSQNNADHTIHKQQTTSPGREAQVKSNKNHLHKTGVTWMEPIAPDTTKADIAEINTNDDDEAYIEDVTPTMLWLSMLW